MFGMGFGGHNGGAEFGAGGEFFEEVVLVAFAGPFAGLIEGGFELVAFEDVGWVVGDAIDGADGDAGVAVDTFFGVDGVGEVFGIEVVDGFGGADSAAVAAVDTEGFGDDVGHGVGPVRLDMVGDGRLGGATCRGRGRGRLFRGCR